MDSTQLLTPELALRLQGNVAAITPRRAGNKGNELAEGERPSSLAGQQGMQIAGAVQHANYLDAEIGREVRDDVLGEALDGVMSKVSQARV